MYAPSTHQPGEAWYTLGLNLSQHVHSLQGAEDMVSMVPDIVSSAGDSS